MPRTQHTDYLWRVEFAGSGRGPYGQGPDGRNVFDAAPFGVYEPTPEAPHRHPMPWADGIKTSPYAIALGLDNRRFGFEDLPDARRWFYEPRDGDYFAQRGLTLAAYPQDAVERLEIGKKQAVFDPAGIEPIRFDIRCLWSEREDTLSRRADKQRAARKRPYDV